MIGVSLCSLNELTSKTLLAVSSWPSQLLSILSNFRGSESVGFLLLLPMKVRRGGFRIRGERGRGRGGGGGGRGGGGRRRE
jgi:hypothetical protein